MTIALACGGLDSVKVVVVPDDAGSGGNPSGGNGASGNSQGGGEPNGGDSSASGAAGESGAAGASDTAGAGGSAGDEANGGEGGQIVIPPDPMPGPPTVVSVSPRDQSTNADPTDTIRISFSEPLDPLTVTSESVQVKDGAGVLVLGTLSYADAIATFRPKGRMTLLSGYSVSVSTAVADLTSTRMERPFASSFTVRDGGWGKAESSLTSSTSAFDRNHPLVLASDGVGRAVAVWTQITDTTTSNYDVYAALFNQGKGWATPVKVNTSLARCQYPSVSMNASGNVIVGWTEYDSTITTQPYSVQARRYIASNWDATQSRIDILSTSTLVVNPENVAVAINANNHAHVAWDAYDYNSTVSPSVNDYGVFVRHADAAGTWDASVKNLTLLQVSTGVSGPSLSFDAAGNGFVAYQFANSASPPKVSTIVYHYVTSNNTWGTSAVGSTASDGVAVPVAIATNPAGDAILSWSRATAVDASNNNYDLMGSFYKQGAWSTPAVISTALTTIPSTKWALASAVWTGTNFLVAWAQSGGSWTNVYANEYNRTTLAWGTATILSDGNHSSAFPWLTADGRGNALAVWYQQSDTPATSSLAPADVVYSRLLGATGKWSSAGRVSSAVAGYRYPQAITLADGSAVATWQRTVNNVNIKLMSVNGVLENDFQ